MRLRPAICLQNVIVTLSMLVCPALPVVAMQPDAAMHLTRYAGELVQPSGNVDGAILRKFEVTVYSSEGAPFFYVSDDAATGCPWPDAFGQLNVSGSDDAVHPHVLYRYGDTDYSVALPPLQLDLPTDIAPDSSWQVGRWQLTAGEKRSIDSIACWYISARERRGRNQTLFVDAVSGRLVRAQMDVFMGQGDQFRLTLSRTSTEVLADPLAARVFETQQQLLSLQAELKRRSDSVRPDLSSRQLEQVAAREAALTELAVNSPLQALVVRMKADLQAQQDRARMTSRRAEQLVSMPAPEFSLNLIDGKTIDSSALKGKTVVLHFWDYRDQPLSEPYGQTGYLDFLANQRGRNKVQILGISTSPDFHTADRLNQAKRSARKLREFMNLNYPIGFDDGSLLRTLGDPRDTDGQLPLWVVLSPDGKIAHYHAGFYEIDVTRGLRELDDVVIEQIRGDK